MAVQWNVKRDAMILKKEVFLGYFETQQTYSLLSCLKIDEFFLSLPPETWSENEDYKQGRERVQQLRVMNDKA